MNKDIIKINEVEDAFISAAGKFKDALVFTIRQYGDVEYVPHDTPEPDYVVKRISSDPEETVTMTIDEELVEVEKVSVFMSDIYVNDIYLIDNTNEYSCVAEFLRNNIKED